jgi:hypothetical protein
LHSSTNISSGEALPEVLQLHHYHKKTECHAVQAPKRGRKQQPQINTQAIKTQINCKLG